MTFKQRFCDHFQCPPEEFELRVFRRCVHRHAWPVARWLQRRHPDWFREDFEFIREVGGLRNPDFFKAELNRFHGRNAREKGWVRGTFGVRVSARRVISLKNVIFSQP